MKHRQNKAFNKTIYGLQRKMAHLIEIALQVFTLMTRAMTPRFISAMIPSFNSDYSNRSTNNYGNISSIKNDSSGKTDAHAEDQNTYFSLQKSP